MDNSEKEKVREDILVLMESWSKHSLNAGASLATGLSVFIHALIDLSPSKKDMMMILGEAIIHASNNSNEAWKERQNENN